MGVYAVATKTDLDSISVAESNYTPDMLGAFSIIAESDKTYNDIMKAIGLAELACLESTGAEIVYEAADSESFIEKIKKFFTNLWNKITSLFKKFIDKVRDWATNDTKFAEKYEKALKDADVSKLEYNGYVFSNLGDTGLIDNKNIAILDILKAEFGVDVTYAAIDKAEKDNATVIKINDESVSIETVSDKMRGVINGGSIKANELDKEIRKLFRSNESEPVKLTNIDIGGLIADIKDSKDLEKKVKEAYNKTSKIIKDDISDLDKLKGNIKKTKATEESDKKWNNTYIAAISKVTNFTRLRLNIITAINGGYLNAISARRVQAKAICVELLKANKKKEDAKAEEPVNASAKFEHTTNYLNKVVLK